MNELPTKNELKVAVVPKTAPVAEIDARRFLGVPTSPQLAAKFVVPFMHYGARKLGHLGVIGVAICIFSGATLVSSVLPLREQIGSQELELAHARTLHAQQREAHPERGRTQTADALTGRFPGKNDLPQVLRQIVTIAGAAGLTLEKGSYEIAATDADSIVRYRLSLPIRGTYPQVRQFIENTLTAVPTVALESLQIQRNEIADSVVTADLQFALLVGNHP